LKKKKKKLFFPPEKKKWERRKGKKIKKTPVFFKHPLVTERVKLMCKYVP